MRLEKLTYFDRTGGQRCVATGKRCRTKDEVHAWLVRYKREHRKDRHDGRWPKLYPYKCSVCSTYHVTKQKPRRR